MLVKYIQVQIYGDILPWSNAFWPGLTPFGPPMWQAEADTEVTLSATPGAVVGQKAAFESFILLSASLFYYYIPGPTSFHRHFVQNTKRLISLQDFF